MEITDLPAGQKLVALSSPKILAQPIKMPLVRWGVAGCGIIATDFVRALQCGVVRTSEIHPSIFNVPASCLPSPKPTPRPAKVEDQQLRYFLQKDKITSFDASKSERNLQKQYKNLIISRSKERLVLLFMTDNFTHTSAYVDTEKKKLVFLTRLLELLSQKQFSMNDYCFAPQSYPKCNYEQLRDFLVLPCKRKLQYITSSIVKDQVLREIFDKVQTLQQKNVFLLVDEVQIRPTVSFSGGLLSGMAENN
ncbi:hypothetical protein FHG87_022685 [Trinorchestia longiramus]|nr:hypothetical protein FHG87_022685 [Trinorchestia longiramus]